MNISVLIAAYQAAPFLQDALESVRAQSHTKWEIIVVEDGSQDGSEDITRRFAGSCRQRVTYVNLGQHMGVAAARNRLLDLAVGEAVAFLDADDIWEENHLAMAAAEIAGGAEFVASGVRTFDRATGHRLEGYSPPPALRKEPVLTLFQGSVIVTSSSVVLSQSLVARAGRFDASFRIGEDRDYWLRCALADGRFQTTSWCTCNYAKHAASSMAKTRVVAEQNIRFYEKYRTLASVPLPLRRRQLAGSLVTYGRLLRAHEPWPSAVCFGRAWRHAPFDPLIPCHLLLSLGRLLVPGRAARAADPSLHDGSRLSHSRP